MIQSWFPTLIYSENLSNRFGESFNSSIYSRLLEIKKEHEKTKDWNCGTYTTLGIENINLFEEKYFSELLDVCKEHVEIFSEEMLVDKKYKLTCKDYWGNIASPGDFQERHTHINSQFSLVYYVKTPENCGDIVFYSPRSEECLTIPTRDGNYSNYMYCTYKAVQSNVIIFRSNVPHMVKQNNSKENRCSIAMNFNYN